MIADERETVVTGSDGDELVTIWTAQQRHITRLRKDDAFTETDSGHFDGTEWASFTIPAAVWSPAGVKRSRKVSDAQRARLAERMAEIRDAGKIPANFDKDST